MSWAESANRLQVPAFFGKGLEDYYYDLIELQENLRW